MKANHPLIIKSLRRMRRAYLLTAFITLPFGVFATCAPLWSSEGRGITLAVVGIGLLSAAVGAYMVWLTKRYWNPEKSPLMEVLRDRAGEIVWIYEQQINSQVAGATVSRAYNIHLQLESGKGYVLSVASPDRDSVLTLLAQLAPRATFGYSRELKKQYKRDPQSVAVAIS